MKDKAGIDIAVGCRVAEADFGYGDGTVESITGPCIGGHGLSNHLLDRVIVARCWQMVRK